jgi:peptidoglycan/xylan/chitin deacetylase (PgdA/CDA1 family)
VAEPLQRSLPKTLALKAITLPGVVDLLAGVTSTEVTVFVLHRFAVPELGIPGHDPATLRQVLAELRKRRYFLIPLAELFRRLREGESVKRAVAFTIDDGYFDHGSVGGPVFAEFDCPVTVFVVTDFLDGRIWLWWDKIAYIFKQTRRTDIAVHLGAEEFRFTLDSDTARAGWYPFAVRCQYASEADRQACIAELSVQAAVELPEKSPPQFAALTWDEVRRLETKGMTFGPHSLSHPILSTTPDAQAEREISESWRRLITQVNQPVPVFCYPGGRSEFFGAREISTVQQLGLLGAVSGHQANVDARQLQNGSDELYRVPRYSYQESLPDVLQCVSGLETLKSRLRRRSVSSRQP